MGTLLREAMLACHGRATSPSSKGSSGKETSDVLNVYIYIYINFCSPIKGFGTNTSVQRTFRRQRQTTTDYIYDISKHDCFLLLFL